MKRDGFTLVEALTAMTILAVGIVGVLGAYSLSSRSGSEAVRLAEQACRATEYHVAILVGTLAAAYAEVGRFPEAVATVEEAITLAGQQKQDQVVEMFRPRLESYKAGRRYYESPPTRTSGPGTGR